MPRRTALCALCTGKVLHLYCPCTAPHLYRPCTACSELYGSGDPEESAAIDMVIDAVSDLREKLKVNLCLVAASPELPSTDVFNTCGIVLQNCSGRQFSSAAAALPAYSTPAATAKRQCRCRACGSPGVVYLVPSPAVMVHYGVVCACGWRLARKLGVHLDA